MAIKTDNNKPVMFLDVSQTIRAGFVTALFGGTNGQLNINPTKQAWLTISSTKPPTVTEPTDTNFTRVRLSNAGVSDFLTISNGIAENSGPKTEIKFNRSMGAWANSYPYFAIYTAQEGGTLLAWGEMAKPITVSAADVVPLFAEGDFAIAFLASESVEQFVESHADED